MATPGNEVDWWSIAHVASLYTVESMVYCLHTAISRKVVGKCTQQSRKVLWMVLSSLFFKEIWKNGMRGHGHVFASVKGKATKGDSTVQCLEQCIDHIPYYLWGLSWQIFSDNLSRNSCITNMVSARWLRRISQGDWSQSETAKYFEWTINRVNWYVRSST